MQIDCRECFLVQAHYLLAIGTPELVHFESERIIYRRRVVCQFMQLSMAAAWSHNVAPNSLLPAVPLLLSLKGRIAHNMNSRSHQCVLNFVGSRTVEAR
eukprot:XP_001707201.1 Hypothetical protein GL50803_87793 [Giardia lamblia ATCC 50803]